MQGWEECRVDRGGLAVLELLGDVTGHSEVGVLVDSGWNQAWEVLAAEDVWERVRESWHCLDRWECKLSNIVRIIEAKNALDLGIVDVFLDTNDIWVHRTNVVDVGEDKRLCWIEAKSQDVLDVSVAHSD